jgi:hypothetical protein
MEQEQTQKSAKRTIVFRGGTVGFGDLAHTVTHTGGDYTPKSTKPRWNQVFQSNSIGKDELHPILPKQFLGMVIGVCQLKFVFKPGETLLLRRSRQKLLRPKRGCGVK